MILFSIITMLSGARSYRQIHTLIDRRLAILNAAFPQAALRRAPAYTSVRGILQQLDPAEMLSRKPKEALAAIRRTITLGGGIGFDDDLALELEAGWTPSSRDQFAHTGRLA